MPVTYEMCQKCACLYERGSACDRCVSDGNRAAVASPPPPVSAPSKPAHATTVPEPIASAVYATPAPTPSGTVTGPEGVHVLAFHGSGGSFFGIHVINMLLTILTLGVYYFWGKVKVRQYLYSQSEFNGDRFAFHGTGRELLWGFLRAFVVFGGLSLLFRAAPLLPGGLAVKITAVLATYLLLFMLIPFAVAATRRYRLSRSSWRGIRFSFRGSIANFVRLYLKGIVLSFLTLGIYYPFFIARQQKYLVSHTYFGNERFRFDGNGHELMKIYLPLTVFPVLIVATAVIVPSVLKLIGHPGPVVAWVGGLTMLLIGCFALIYPFWFEAAKQRYLWNHTKFGAGDARFHATMSGGGLFLLKSGNAFLLLLTLGLAWPWTMVRNTNFLFNHLTLEGALDLSAVRQDAQSATALGEGLDSLMDLDAGFAT
jgi:uncharacterized membrane protein YjgN (DUF898 family)